MPHSPDDLLKLLLVAHPDDAVEWLLGSDPELMPRLYARLVHDNDGLQHQLGAEPWDLVLARTQVNGMSLAGAVESVQSANSDVPIIAFEDAPSRERVVDALRSGARDLVDSGTRDHLLLVIERELANVREKRARRLLDAQHREFQRQTFALLNSLNDPIFIVRAGRVLHANPAAVRLCGWSELDDVRKRPFLELVAVKDRSRMKSFLNNLTGGTKLQRIEIAMLSRDGLPFATTLSFSRTSFGGTRSHLAIVRTSASQADARQAMYAMNQWDQLTGLHTQRHFLARLADRLAAVGRHGDASALLLIELENFRVMRQTVGIVASDLLVKDLASVVAHEARDAQAVGRFGNHTFAVLLDDQDPDSVCERAEQLRAGIERHTSEVAGQSLATTCSVAVVALRAEHRDVDAVMREAEQLCRQAIELGGNRVMRPAVEPRAEIGAPSRHPAVIDVDRLCMLCQPIVHLHGGQEESYEVWLALRDGQEGLLTGDTLYSDTDDRGRVELDRWLLENAIAIAHAKQLQGHDVHFFIRLSTNAVSDESTLVRLSRLLRTHGVDRHRLTFEIPERCAAQQVRSARAFVNAAKKLYCTTALDGFGTDVSSTHALAQLGVEHVKLGPNLIENLAQDHKRQIALRSLHDKLHHMGRTTIATQVNDVGTLMLLWQCGIDYAQGDCIREPGERMGYDFHSAFEYVSEAAPFDDQRSDGGSRPET